MLKITGDFDYYPTPDSLLDDITADLDWKEIKSVLEPSAGTGNIAEYVKSRMAKADRYYSDYWIVVNTVDTKTRNK